MTNRLAGENSPYLLQHADNPVEWYPWSEEAIDRAREEGKPILLSVGYAACHWCHVMAHESFEDPETAALMNKYFINIKVDREERPDIDSIYMDAVVTMTGQGGWPMTVALTPSGKPFFGGTYFPPDPRYGMPSFKQVLLSLAQAWSNRQQEILQSADDLTEQIGKGIALKGGDGTLTLGILDQSTASIEQLFDSAAGGFGKAPKFPQAMIIEYLLRRYIRTGNSRILHMCEQTLMKMAYGGIYDQLGGGFARYSTDNRWLVPHFEKMLYDNALLSRVYLHAWRLTGRPLYHRIVEETLDWALLEMRHLEGGFYSSLDADSEGEEGKFYVWESEELRSILDEDAELFMHFYGVSEGGNWKGRNILNIRTGLDEVALAHNMEAMDARARISAARQKLYAVRAKRTWPGLDDKILTAWNGLLLISLAEAGRDLGREDYSEAAQATAEFLYKHARSEDGRLLRSWKANKGSRFNAYLEDYAYLANGLLALYQNTYEERWFRWAEELAELMVKHFLDEDEFGFFDTSNDHEALINRPKGLQDNAIPSGNAVAADVLLQLSLYTGNSRHWDIANKAVNAMSKLFVQYPTGFGHWLGIGDMILGEPIEVAIIGDIKRPDTRELINAVFKGYRPNQVVAVGLEGSVVPLLKDRPMRDGRATAYVCRQFACKTPVTKADELEHQLL